MSTKKAKIKKTKTITDNSKLKQQALTSLSGNWEIAIGVCIVYSLLSGLTNKVADIGPLVSMILMGPLSLGLAIFSLAISRNKKATFPQMFEGFNNFKTSLVAYLTISLYIFLWSLLFIIPGIIKAISYSQTYYILADDGALTANEALLKSQKMMEKFKLKYAYLLFSFFGWFLVSILTFGIGFLWLFPYMQVSLAKFYDDIK